MRWRFTDHIQIQLTERKISIQLVKQVLEAPDEVVQGKKTRLIYQKKSGNELIRVVTEEEAVITVYVTGKLKKYYHGGGK